MPQRIDISWVEHRDAVGTTEDQTAIRQLTRGAVNKLIASDTIGLIERGDASCLTVPSVQTFHRGYPDITLTVFLDAPHVRAGDACNACYLVALQVVAQKTVAHGTNPHVALGVLNHIGRDIHTPSDALRHRGDIKFRELPRLWIQFQNIL